MSVESVAPVRPELRVRVDAPATFPIFERYGPWAALLVIAAAFVLVGAANLDLGETEARIGLSASEPLGPYGQTFGGWEPAVWTGQVVPCALWARVQGGIPNAGIVRWPSAIAAVLIGFLIGRRVLAALGTRALIVWGFCWFGSIAAIDRSSSAGLDLITGLATIAAIDRLVSGGPGLAAGLWASLAFLAGGWPPLAVIALTLIVLGRNETSLSFRFLAPPCVTFAAWSLWALSRAPTEAWAAALALPLTRHSAWLLVAGVLALGLPWSPFAALVAFRDVRQRWSPQGRSMVLGWLQVAGVCLLTGTLIPGLASAAQLPAIAGLAVAATAGLDRVAAGGLPARLRRTFLGICVAVVGLWLAVVLVRGIHLASAVPYYRGISIILLTIAVFSMLAVFVACLRSESWRALTALVLVAVCLKLAHWGYYVPEWNYRFSQGPWGRAIGQWVIQRWPIYTEHTWPADLAFAIGRPIRQIPHPKVLAYQPGPNPKFVLLLKGEFANWPSEAPRLFHVATFQDQFGGTRVLARTEGDQTWRRLAHSLRDE